VQPHPVNNPVSNSPVLGEEGGDRVGENLALIVDVVEDVFGPLHQVSYLVAR